MDKNSIFGILLIAAILIIWVIVQKPNKKQLETQAAGDTAALVTNPPTASDTIKPLVTTETSALPITNDTLNEQTLQNTYGEFAALASGNNKFYTIENDLIRIL